MAGDAGRGQSLIVWAIAEGRAAAAAVDTFLTGSTTLPAPIPPTARPLRGLSGGHRARDASRVHNLAAAERVGSFQLALGSRRA